ncbi:hypothetical protein C1J03_20275 [Sulfitobacter sp. SK012]|nr:hypothetical protein C1J03_20275 [Sulfitobacter sp. SK012]
MRRCIQGLFPKTLRAMAIFALFFFARAGILSLMNNAAHTSSLARMTAPSLRALLLLLARL